MNKIAAEKIASEYYDLGVKHAQDKLASAFQRGFWPTINALGGAGLGLRTADIVAPKVRGFLGSKSDYLGNVFSKADAIKAVDTAKAELAILKSLYSESVPAYKAVIDDAASKVTNLAAKAGPELTAVESLANIAPTLAIAGGVGTGAYKGLRKLDRWASR